MGSVAKRTPRHSEAVEARGPGASAAFHSRLLEIQELQMSTKRSSKVQEDRKPGTWPCHGHATAVSERPLVFRRAALFVPVLPLHARHAAREGRQALGAGHAVPGPRAVLRQEGVLDSHPLQSLLYRI